MEFDYSYFIECLKEGDQREFWYGDQILIVRSDVNESVFSIEHLGKIVFKQKFKSPQELIDIIRINGKSLEDIWDELKPA